MDVSESSRQLLRSIGLAYAVFLKDGGLQDTNLTRMTYFSVVRKTYLEDPVEDDDVQRIVLEHIDKWMAEIEKAMNDAMPKAQSMSLHVVTKGSVRNLTL